MIMSNRFYKIHKNKIDEFIELAIKEDVGHGDHSSLSCFDMNANGSLVATNNESCVIAGLSLVKKIIQKQNNSIKIKLFIEDGCELKKNQKILTLSGPKYDILAIERLTLNCLQRMSGIATLTRSLAAKISHTSCKILDTRKTTPNFRYAEKWAVLIGGGINHRMGLFDSIMLKDNHIDFSGSVTLAIQKTKKYLSKNNLNLPVIVETRNIKEIKECLNFEWITRILLDNMNLVELESAVKLIDNKIQTEASGNISALNIVDVAETGVDYVSIGALTHSYKNIDLSMKTI